MHLALLCDSTDLARRFTEAAPDHVTISHKHTVYRLMSDPDANLIDCALVESMDTWELAILDVALRQMHSARKPFIMLTAHHMTDDDIRFHIGYAAEVVRRANRPPTQE